MAQRRAYRGAHRGEGEEEHEEEKFEIDESKRHLGEYVRVINKNTEIFSTADPSILLEALLGYIKMMGYSQYQVSKDKYKVKLSFISKKDEEGEMKIEVLSVGKDKVCVDFTKLQGDCLVFFKEFNQIKDYLADLADATY